MASALVLARAAACAEPAGPAVACPLAAYDVAIAGSGKRETPAPGTTRVSVNGASAIEGHHSQDAEFRTRMHRGTN